MGYVSEPQPLPEIGLQKIRFLRLSKVSVARQNGAWKYLMEVGASLFRRRARPYPHVLQLYHCTIDLDNPPFLHKAWLHAQQTNTNAVRNCPFSVLSEHIFRCSFSTPTSMLRHFGGSRCPAETSAFLGALGPAAASIRVH